MAAQRVPELEFSGLHNNGTKFLSPNLRAGLTIYPLQDDHAFAPRRGAGARRIDWLKESPATVMSLSWDKQMGQPAGQWSATIKPKQTGIQFRDLEVLDGDWVDVSVLRNGIRIPVCRGVVDSVRESVGVVSGATATTYTITGRDHGAFFDYPVTWSSLWARAMDDTVHGFMTTRLDWKQGGRPDQIFAALIHSYFLGGDNGGGQWEIPQSLTETIPRNSLVPPRLPSTIAAFGPTHEELHARLSEALKVVTFNAFSGFGAPKGLRGALFNKGLWRTGDQTLHQTLAKWVNPLLNEWWCDLLLPQAFTPKNGLHAFLSTQSELFQSRKGVEQAITAAPEDFGTMAAIIRERPFMNRDAGLDSMWSNLPTWTIPTWLVANSNLGLGGATRKNLFELLADVGFAPHSEHPAFGQSQWLRSDVKQRGLRPYSETTNYIAGTEGGWQHERLIWLSLLQDWWGPSPYLREGTITVNTLLPEIRIGQRVLLDPGDPKQVEQFYVEGVSMAYTGPTRDAGAGGTTTLIVGRGFRGDDKALFSGISELSSRYESTRKSKT
jgi:hypothetical protein